MLRYFENAQDYGLEYVHFEYLGCTYTGRGWLHWSPDDGAEIHATVDTEGDLPDPIHLGAGLATPSLDQQCIRMRLHGLAGTAFAPDVWLRDRIDLINYRHLHVRVPRLVIVGGGNPRLGPDVSRGAAVLYGRHGMVMPDRTTTVHRYAGQRGVKGRSQNLVKVGDRVGARFTGIAKDNDHLQVRWKLKPRYHRLGRWWRWSEAFLNAICILSGTELTAVCAHVETARRTWLEVRRKRAATDLGFLSPVPGEWLDKADLQRLTRFLYAGGPEAEVSRQIFRQLAEASRQKTQAGHELLTGTILEAALRTLQGVPYVHNRRNEFDAVKALRRFQRDYLDRSWDSARKDVHEAWKRLRHRNAHPDWLFGGKRPDAWHQMAQEDLILVSQFYGAMILAMAGKQDPDKPQVPDLSKGTIRVSFS